MKVVWVWLGGGVGYSGRGLGVGGVVLCGGVGGGG